MNFAFQPSTAFRRLSTLAAIFAAVVSAHATNILVNPGFETGAFAPWTTSGGTGVITNTEAHSGTFSFAAFSSDEVTQTFAPVATSAISELSFWGKRNGGLFDLIILSYSDASSENVLVNTTGQGNGWTFVNITGDLDAGKSLVGFRIYGTTSGPAYLDDFKIEVATATVPESAATLPLLALGLVGIGA
ncbi:MAG: hypothetical protein ABIR80_01140, partial [Opitutaceae bacterium]